MTYNPIGDLVQGQGMTEQEMNDYVAHAAKANLRTMSGLNNFELCKRVKNVLPSCVVVHRDSNFEPSPGYTMDAFTKYLAGLDQDKRIVIMVNCEWGWSAGQVSMWCDMIETAEALGWHLCVGNTSCGSIKCGQGKDPNDWVTVGLPLLLTLAKYPGSYIGFHNYTGPFAWLVSNGGWGDPQKPPDKIDWTLPQWHLGREAQGILRAIEVQRAQHPDLLKLLERAFIICTEGIFDQMGDTAANGDNPYHTIQSNRWRWLNPFWAQWYKKEDGTPKNAEDVLADQAIWAWEKVYAPLAIVVGIHMFTFRDAGGQWQDDRTDNATIYLKRMEAYRSTAASFPPIVTPIPQVDPPVPPKEPPPVVIPPAPPIIIDARSSYARIADLYRQLATEFDKLDSAQLPKSA